MVEAVPVSPWFVSSLSRLDLAAMLNFKTD